MSVGPCAYLTVGFGSADYVTFMRSTKGRSIPSLSNVTACDLRSRSLPLAGNLGSKIINYARAQKYQEMKFH